MLPRLPTLVPRRRGVRAAAALGALALLLTACGPPPARTTPPPRQELVAGLAALGHSSALTVTAHLDATAAELTALAQASGHHSPASLQAAQLLATGSVRLELRTANGAALDAQGQHRGLAARLAATHVDLSVRGDGATLAELRAVGTTVYVRADAARIATLLHANLAALSARLAGAPAALTDAVGAVLAGRWIALPLGSQLPGAASSTGPSPRQLDQRLLAALGSAVSVRRTGSSGGTDHLVVTTSTSRLRQALLGTLRGLLPANPLLSKLASARASARPVTVQVDVRAGVLTGMSLDLVQFASAADRARLAGVTLPLQVDFATTAPPITAPSQATTVDLSTVVRGLFATRVRSAVATASLAAGAAG